MLLVDASRTCKEKLIVSEDNELMGLMINLMEGKFDDCIVASIKERYCSRLLRNDQNGNER